MAPVLVINPRSDEGFVTHVYALANTTALPEALEELVRERYPRAVVRRRGLDGERREVWYVYREGHWISSAHELKGRQGGTDNEPQER